MASDRAFIFHMCVPYDKTFLLVPNLLTLWPWPWSFTHFSKTLTLAISFERKVIWLSYFTCSLWQHLSIGTNFFDFVTLMFDPLFKNLNIGHIFWMASDMAFIFHMCVPYDKTFLLVPKSLTLWPWSLILFSRSLTLVHIFWMVSDKAFICVFLMTRPFYWYQIFWPCGLTHFSKTLTLAISFEW
jgi:hypothetical protein